MLMNKEERLINWIESISKETEEKKNEKKLNENIYNALDRKREKNMIWFLI